MNKDNNRPGRASVAPVGAGEAFARVPAKASRPLSTGLTRRGLRSGLCFGLVAPIMAACANQAVENPTTVEQALELEQQHFQPEYLLGPGDDLDIRFYYNPEMDTEVVVRPDGKISLPLVDELQVAGRPVSAVSADLRERYSQELRRPEVSVIVRSFTGNRYYVGGEVATPGAISMPGQITVLQAIMESGGLLTSARSDEIAIIRRVPGSDPVVVAVNVDDVLTGRATGQDLMLHPQDVVFVPRSNIAEVNRFIDLYIRQNIPVGVGIGIPIGGGD